MDKNAIKKYAVWARRELIERVSQRALIYGITAKDAGDPNAESVNGHLLSQAEKRQRQALIRNIKEKGYEQVMEEVAYTWFNRFAALRFMEVNGYLPSHIRVFTNDVGEFKPQILAEAIHLELDGLDINKVYELESANKSEELFKYLLILQCNALNSILPGMFQRIEDYSELLLPDYLLREGSVIDRLISDISEDYFNVRSENGIGQIEIIGWLYQYYISEKHEEVVDPLHGKVVKKEEVPAATQLFTTDWVVRYLIDNSVGRYWIERNPNSTLADKLTYFVKPKSGEIEYVNETIIPQDLSIFDPCVGSGHFLVYAFDVMMQIYMEYGYSEREAAVEIVKNNLYGLDIDGRAIQLAYFAVMMKARQYDRRFFTRGIQPHIHEITESNTADMTSIEQFYCNNAALKRDVEALLDTLIDAKEYGSILHMPTVDFGRINERFTQLAGEISIYNTYLLGDFRTMIRSAEIMSGEYAVVATNPPYLNKYDDKLKEFIYANYKEYCGDLFSVFIHRNFGFCKRGGYTGFMTPFVWMFIKTYESLRRFIVSNKQIVTLIQMEYSAYEEATVPICAFVTKNAEADRPGLYFKLSEFKGGMDVQRQKVLQAISSDTCNYFYETRQRDYTIIPSCAIAFWANKAQLRAFEIGKTIGELYKTITGSSTGENAKFLRLWYELDISKIGFDLPSTYDGYGYKWIPCNKGGAFRKWYGNQDYVINWDEDGTELKAFATYKNHGKHWSRFLKSLNCFYHEGITWSKITSARFSARYMPEGFIMESAANAIMPQKDSLPYLLALMNSSIVQRILKMLNPTINMQAGDITSIPIIKEETLEERIEWLSKECVRLSKEDWDSFEQSWHFTKHPFIGDYNTVEDAYKKWEKKCDERFREVKQNEQELDRLFSKIYGMEDEGYIVDDASITIARGDLKRDIQSFISYAVGCMFGRYSLDYEGVAYAGGDWNNSLYRTVIPDQDNIIPICDDEYFDDDIVSKFVDFVSTVFSVDHLEENLEFIAKALGGIGPARDIIRKYFLEDFYEYHCASCAVSASGKRPYYWLFDSGKKNGFKCLIYMHRYQPDTIARIRTDYVHEQQSRYRTAIIDLEQRINGAPTSERVKLSKQLATRQAQAKEIRVYEEKIHHLADQMIKIDLDDGVKHNYEIFKDVLAKIK